MSVFKCKMCGGTLEINENQSTAVCEYCGTKQTLPKLGDDKRANLYDRANHFRRNNEFDKAMGIYEKILNDDNTDAEAYWSLVLCRYGIEYVEDPVSHKRVPTVNRAQFTSIFDDDNYKSAIKYADGYQKSIYEEEAKAINEIQKGILAISQKEEPFDVFICYKETDNSGRRTRDSVIANDLYHQLTKEGFKVFFSRITLEDKLGTAYEPYIFAALNSAKVMVVIGTKAEYFNAVWVKNEWSRYLALIKNGAKKVLIPAYRDMDPYDLPEEFSHLQAQDMSKLGFMQDLIRGIKKLTESDTRKSSVKETVVLNTGADTKIEPLLKRAFMYLEDGSWEEADAYCERVLDRDPENAMAYLGKLMAELKVNKRENLSECDDVFEENGNYQKIMRFGDASLKKELHDDILQIQYNFALKNMNEADSEDAFKLAAEKFEEISGFKDADEKAEECFEKAETARKDEIYSKAQKIECTRSSSYGLAAMQEKISLDKQAINLYESIPGWRDADERAAICKKEIDDLILKLKRTEEENRLKEEACKKKVKKITAIGTPVAAVLIAFVIILNTLIIPAVNYNKGVKFLEEGNYNEAVKSFTAAENFKDAKEQIFAAYYAEGQAFLKSGNYNEAGASFISANGYKDSALLARELNASSISAGTWYTVGLKKDGTVVAVGDNDDGQCDVSGWKDIVAVSAGGSHTVGLKKDGTVVATEYTGDDRYNYGQCDVSGWKDIVAVSAGSSHTVGLKKDGTVVAVGRNFYGQCNVSDWKDIVAVSAGGCHTVGLKKDGTVVATGYTLDYEYYDGQCDVSGWKDIVAVSAGDSHTVGLKKDGTVVAVGDNDYGRCDVSGWKDIVAVSAGFEHTVGLKKDGTVVVVGDNDDVSGWKDIKLPKM